MSYTKQREDPLKGDWFELLKKYFKFIGLEINEKEIAKTPKIEYKKQIKKLVEKAALQYMLNVKNGLSKIVYIRSDTLKPNFFFLIFVNFQILVKLPNK